MATSSDCATLPPCCGTGKLAYCGSLADLVGEDPAVAPADALQEALEPVYAGTAS